MKIEIPPSPMADWSEEELIAHALQSLGDSKADDEEVVKLGRRSIKNYLAAGEALGIIKERHIKTGTWVKWQETNHARFGSRPTISDAILFFTDYRDKPDRVEGCLTVAACKQGMGWNDIPADANADEKPKRDRTKPTPSMLKRPLDEVGKLCDVLASAASVLAMTDKLPADFNVADAKEKLTLLKKRADELAKAMDAAIKAAEAADIKAKQAKIVERPPAPAKRHRRESEFVATSTDLAVAAV